MRRQSISLTSPNDEWLKAQIESEEYTSKSEIVNDLIRHARAQQQEIQLIRTKLIKSENSGFTNQTAFFSSSFCGSRFWSTVETREYPIKVFLPIEQTMFVDDD